MQEEGQGGRQTADLNSGSIGHNLRVYTRLWRNMAFGHNIEPVLHPVTFDFEFSSQPALRQKPVIIPFLPSVLICGFT